ncbi:MAG: hypothetical protein ACJ8AT_01435 [Hyalangium sp.]
MEKKVEIQKAEKQEQAKLEVKEVKVRKLQLKTHIKAAQSKPYAG